MLTKPDEFEKFKGESLKTLVPTLDDDGLDLLGVYLLLYFINII